MSQKKYLPEKNRQLLSKLTYSLVFAIAALIIVLSSIYVLPSTDSSWQIGTIKNFLNGKGFYDNILEKNIDWGFPYFFLYGLFCQLFGINRFAIWLLIYIFMGLTSFSSYLVFRQFFNKSKAVLGSFLILFLLYCNNINEIRAELFLLILFNIILYFFLLYLGKQKKYYIFLNLILCYICIPWHQNGVVMPLVFLLFIFYLRKTMSVKFFIFILICFFAINSIGFLLVDQRLGLSKMITGILTGNYNQIFDSEHSYPFWLEYKRYLHFFRHQGLNTIILFSAFSYFIYLINNFIERKRKPILNQSGNNDFKLIKLFNIFKNKKNGILLIYTLAVIMFLTFITTSIWDRYLSYIYLPVVFLIIISLEKTSKKTSTFVPVIIIALISVPVYLLAALILNTKGTYWQAVIYNSSFISGILLYAILLFLQFLHAKSYNFPINYINIYAVMSAIVCLSLFLHYQEIYILGKSYNKILHKYKNDVNGKTIIGDHYWHFFGLNTELITRYEIKDRYLQLKKNDNTLEKILAKSDYVFFSDSIKQEINSNTINPAFKQFLENQGTLISQEYLDYYVFKVKINVYRME